MSICYCCSRLIRLKHLTRLTHSLRMTYIYMSYLGPSCIRWHIYMSWSKISNGSVMRVVFTQTKSFHRQLSWNTYSHTETYLLNYDIYICHPYMGTLRDYSVRMTYIYVKSFFAPMHLIDIDRYFYTKIKLSLDEIGWHIRVVRRPSQGAITIPFPIQKMS